MIALWAIYSVICNLISLESPVIGQDLKEKIAQRVAIEQQCASWMSENSLKMVNDLHGQYRLERHIPDEAHPYRCGLSGFDKGNPSVHIERWMPPPKFPTPAQPVESPTVEYSPIQASEESNRRNKAEERAREKAVPPQVSPFGFGL